MKRNFTKKIIYLKNGNNQNVFQQAMAKSTVVYPYPGILLSNKKEKTTDTYITDGLQG